MAYQRGSGFVGLQQYLNANQQAGAGLGQAALGQVQQAQQGVRNAADTTVGEVEQAALAGTPVYSDPGSVEEAQARAAGRGTAYTGPQGFSPEQWGALSQKADEAGRTAQYGTTDAGVATLLQQQYGRGYTGVGGRTLDAALARRSAGEGLDTAAGKGMEGLRGYLNTANERVAAASERGMEGAANTRAQYAAYQPPATYGDQRHNVIQTPGTMPEPKERVGRNRLRGIGHWLTGGDY